MGQQTRPFRLVVLTCTLRGADSHAPACGSPLSVCVAVPCFPFFSAGLELAGLSVDTRTGSLILETGVTQRWAYASYRKTPQTTQEAEEWTVRQAPLQAPPPGSPRPAPRFTRHSAARASRPSPPLHPPPLLQAAKGSVGGLHFLAIQADAEAEVCTGFWLLRDVAKNI